MSFAKSPRRGLRPARHILYRAARNESVNESPYGRHRTLSLRTRRPRAASGSAKVEELAHSNVLVRSSQIRVQTPCSDKAYGPRYASLRANATR